jgi:putative hydrolase of the HAD superfamily
MRRAVLLDALGTLVGFEDPAPRLRAGLAARHGIEVSEAQAREAVLAEIAVYRAEHGAAGDRDTLAALRRRCASVVRAALGLDADLDALTPTVVDAFRFAPFPEVPGVLAELRARGCALAVVSNWDVSLHEVLEQTGLRPLVDAVVVSAEIGAAKPDPEPFRRALAALGVAAEDALHAGDQLDEDVAGARAAGVTPVLVDRAGDADAADIAVIASLEGLLELSS